MDEEMRKKVERRAQEILDMDPKERSERIMRQLAERIAYHEIRAEEERGERERSGRE
jgi:hypothetical protein